MTGFLRLLPLLAALCAAAGRPACCVADVFLARGCCAEATAVAQAERCCSCCRPRPVDRDAERWESGPSSCTDACGCCARNPVASHPSDGDGPRPCPAAPACVPAALLGAPPAASGVTAAPAAIGVRAPPVPRLLPLLL